MFSFWEGRSTQTSCSQQNVDITLNSLCKHWNTLCVALRSILTAITFHRILLSCVYPPKYPILLSSPAPFLHLFIQDMYSYETDTMPMADGRQYTVELSPGTVLGNSWPFFELDSTLCFWHKGRGERDKGLSRLFLGAHNNTESPNGFVNLVLAKREFFQIILIIISRPVWISGVGGFVLLISRKLREGQ